jgi:hypothetical protein
MVVADRGAVIEADAEAKIIQLGPGADEHMIGDVEGEAFRRLPPGCPGGFQIAHRPNHTSIRPVASERALM